MYQVDLLSAIINSYDKAVVEAISTMMHNYVDKISTAFSSEVSISASLLDTQE